jgi:Flp pilus assembly protein TadD
MESTDDKTKTQQAWEATPDLAVLAIEKQARTFYSEERLDRSRELFEKLVKMRPEVGPYHALLGIIHRRQERWVPALQSLQRAVEIDSTDRNALVNLGESLIIVGKAEEGVDILSVVFKMGYEKGKPPAEQDQFTKRAGAQLALLEQAAKAVKEEKNSGED